MKKAELGKAIYDAAYITGEFKLRSGAVSNEYFDKYQFEARPKLLTEIAAQLNEMINGKVNFDMLAALEMGGIPIGTALSLAEDYDLVLVRKEAKEYGTCNLAEGKDIDGKKLLIVEDVVTSGGQIVISAEELRERGAVIEDAVCVINREADGEAKLAASDIKLHSLFKMSELKEYAEV